MHKNTTMPKGDINPKIPAPLPGNGAAPAKLPGAPGSKAGRKPEGFDGGMKPAKV